MAELHTAWYDYVLKGGKKPELLKDRVACFIMGRNTWVYGPDLAHFEGRPLVLHLDASGAVAGDVTHTGRLRDKPAAAASVVLTSDPKYLPSRAELVAEYPNFLTNQREVFDELPSRVVLMSTRLTAETVITGRPKLRLNITSDQPDGDVFVDVFEVLADGSSIFLSHAAMRLRYRNGGVDGVPLVPGKPEHVELSGFTFFARALAKGSRLRIVIDNGPQFGWQRNSHTGGNLATEPTSAGRIGKLTIATGADAGSVLELPRPDPSIVK
jgi:putative CocE/NonD family hydrolase